MTPRTLGDLLDLTEPDEPADHASSTPGQLVPGEQIHFYAPINIETRETPHDPGVIVGRGATVTLTAEILRLNRDRFGWSWLEIVEDVPEQVRRYGRVLFAKGPFPSDAPRFEPGSPEAADERDRRLEAASKLPEANAAAERARIRAEFGTRGGTTVLGNFSGGNS